MSSFVTFMHGGYAWMGEERLENGRRKAIAQNNIGRMIVCEKNAHHRRSLHKK